VTAALALHPAEKVEDAAPGAKVHRLGSCTWRVRERETSYFFLNHL
jgi:hypothetical protein